SALWLRGRRVPVASVPAGGISPSAGLARSGGGDPGEEDGGYRANLTAPLWRAAGYHPGGAQRSGTHQGADYVPRRPDGRGAKGGTPPPAVRATAALWPRVQRGAAAPGPVSGGDRGRLLCPNRAELPRKLGLESGGGQRQETGPAPGGRAGEGAGH